MKEKVGKRANILQTLILLMFLGCGSEITLNSKEFELKNKAGKLYISYPFELDTIYTWTDYSDCTCCNNFKIRLSKSDLDNIAESGFYYSGKIPDTINQITIIQADTPDCEEFELISDILAIRIDKYKQSVIGYDANWIIKELKTINSKNFGVIGLEVYEGETSKLTDSILELMTIVDGELILIEFKCRNDSCEDYVEKMLNVINDVNLS